MSVRLAKIDDLPLLIRHRRGMLEDMGRYPSEYYNQHDRDYEGWARERLQNGQLVGFVVEDAGRAVASGCLWLKERQPVPGFPGGRVPYLMSVFTERDCRKQGHAAELTKAALAWAQERKYPLVALHASAAGRNTYEKLGFQRTWEMQLRWDGDGQPPVV
ncbi:MAG: GNAT family N-acetyltransferase [Planctomycetes bacterium]|nr:GNAT family N-acetyltransferase [Planctomycetota bacterium]MCB9934684.1 GNAT family N-acetyltransferase [Planctomycetota bacterium]